MHGPLEKAPLFLAPAATASCLSPTCLGLEDVGRLGRRRTGSPKKTASGSIAKWGLRADEEDLERICVGPEVFWAEKTLGIFKGRGV